MSWRYIHIYVNSYPDIIVADGFYISRETLQAMSVYLFYTIMWGIID